MEYYYVECLPDSCYECSCCHSKDYDSGYKLDGEKFCGITNMEVDNHYDYNGKPNWCPLREIPKKKIGFHYADEYDYCAGWNDCLEKMINT